MPHCIVIADDFTGANGTGVLLTKLNLKTSTITNWDQLDFNQLAEFDAVICPTDSRGIQPAEAYKRVFDAISLLKSPEVRLYGKRIDSTLRGNLGAEIDGMLDGLADGRLALVVPSFPQAGRTTAGGYLLVNGVMLQKTDAARDPKKPVHTSLVENVLQQQTRHPVASIYLDTVYRGVEAVKEAILALKRGGKRIIVVDALELEDLSRIAEAAVVSGVPFVAVDPGPFTAAVAGKTLALPQHGSRGKILMSVGSVSGLTKLQIEEMLTTYPAYVSFIGAGKLVCGGENAAKEIARATQDVLLHREDTDLFCVVVNSINPESRLNFGSLAAELCISEEQLSLRLNRSIAEITCNILEGDSRFQGLYSTGGDITVAVCGRLQASGMRLLEEVIPLAAYGTLIGGKFPGLKIVTKGGMVGDKDGAKQCIRFLKERLR